MAENKQWTAYGDVNPTEHGGVWIREDEDCKGSFYIVRYEPFGEGNGYLFTGYVTPTDDWIVKADVFSYADLDDDSPIERKAIACFDYYGADNFSGEAVFYTSKEIPEQLKSEGIEV